MKRRGRFPSAVLPVLAVLVFGLAGVSASVEMETLSSGGDTLYMLKNAHLKAVIDPANGGSVRSGSPEEYSEDFLGETFSYTALEDRLRDTSIAYAVDNSTQSNSVATLTLHWEGPNGLVVRKNFSLLASELVLRVNYTIENGSQEKAALFCRSKLNFTVSEALELRGLGEDGLRVEKPQELSVDETLTLESPRWLCLIGEESHKGLMQLPSVQMLKSAEVTYSGAETSIGILGRSITIPAGKVLKSDLNLVRLRGVKSIVGQGQNIACAMEVETAGQTVRVKSNLLPLADLSSRTISLVFKDDQGEQVGELKREPTDLVCGEPEKFTFYWEAPQEGTFTCELKVAQKTEQPPLVAFSFDTATGDIEWQDARPSEATLSDLEDWEPRRPKVAQTTDREAKFYNARGDVIEQLWADVGLQEYETAVFDIEAPELGAQNIKPSLSEVTGVEGENKIPNSAISLERLTPLPDEEDPAAPDVDRVRFALHLNSFGLKPGTYKGKVQLSSQGNAPSLPLTAKVWPVRRGQPGLVRFHAHCLRFSPTREQEDLQLWRKLRRYQSAAVLFKGRGMWQNDWVRLLESGLPLGSPEATSSLSSASDALPPLDFSAIGPWLGDLLLVGMRDFVLVSGFRRHSVAPRLSDAETELEIPWQERSKWFWGQFSQYMKKKGFGNLYMMSPRPVGAETMDWRWQQAASALASAGWSVCGPYRESAIEMTSVPYLTRFSDLIMVEESALNSVRDVLDEKHPGRADGAQIGLWIPDFDLSAGYETSRDRIWEAWRMGVSVLAVSPPRPRRPYGPPGSRTGETSLTAAETVDKISWEGARDAVDEINYLAQIDWYLREIESNGRTPSETSNLARRIRSALRSRPPKDSEQNRENWPPLTKRDLLSILTNLREDVAGMSGRLYWHDLLLFSRERSRIKIVVDEEQPAQTAQASILKELIRIKSGVSVPLLDASSFSPSVGQPVTLLLGTDVLNPAIQTVLDAQNIETSELAQRLSKDKHMILQFTGKADPSRRFIVLLGVDKKQLGRAVMNFRMGLHHEGDWLVE